MNARDADRPRGQVLLITAFSMLVLIGITAIVVDLGMSWMLRRQEQNAADPAAIAAARYIQDGDTPATRAAMDQAACFYAKENGFFQNDDGACTAAFVSDQLQVFWPPIGPLAGDFAGRPGDGAGDHLGAARVVLRTVPWTAGGDGRRPAPSPPARRRARTRTHWSPSILTAAPRAGSRGTA